jgi:hypothetical protein
MRDLDCGSGFGEHPHHDAPARLCLHEVKLLSGPIRHPQFRAAGPGENRLARVEID